MKNISKICIICGKKFTKPKNCGMPEWKNKRKLCSRECSDKSKIGQIAWNKGLHIQTNTGKTHFKKGQHPSSKTEFKKGDLRLIGNTDGFKKGFIPWNKGKKWKEMQGKNHPFWKGNEASYFAKHIYLVKKFGHSKKCEFCGINGKYIYCKNNRKRWSIHWANKTDIYTRDINDYIGLCKICHSRFDKNRR